MKLRRVMIAAPKSGSGKTTVTCALLQALKNSGQRVVSYKCGPDYIDPMFHKKVIDIPSKNLDTFFTGEEATKALFLKGRTEEDFAVLEGVMGLFDGLGGIRREGSSYHLAEVTKTPIVMVVDAKGMGRSVIPMIAGFLTYDTKHLIKGVILNRMSGSYYELLKPLLERELSVPVLGYLPEHKQFCLESRHLGLVMPDELADIKGRLLATAEEFQKTVSVEKLAEIAEGAETLECGYEIRSAGSAVRNGPVIAVAKDEAFCFYYEDNLLMLQEYGAGIAYFSPLHDTKLPDGCSGLLIGGGYPELYAGALGRNYEMMAEIRKAIENGIPTVAECGGFMYLHSLMKDKEGNGFCMAGVIPSICCDTGKLVRFGYVELEEKRPYFLPEGERIKGHEFHYFDSEDNGDDCLAVKPVTGRSYACVKAAENRWFGFPHLYYPSNPAFARNFVKKAGSYRESRFCKKYAGL